MGVFPVSLSETAVASAAFLECPIPLWNDLERRGAIHRGNPLVAQRLFRGRGARDYADLSQSVLDGLHQRRIFGRHARLETSQNGSLSADEEFRKVPMN